MKSNNRLMYLLSMAQQAMRKGVNARLSQAGLEVTLAQSALLFLLGEKDGRNMSELSRLLGIDNSAITGFIDRMEKSKMVRRQPDPGDRRASLIKITSKGSTQAKQAALVVGRMNTEMKKGFTPEEMDAFVRVLKAAIDRFGKK